MSSAKYHTPLPYPIRFIHNALRSQYKHSHPLRKTCTAGRYGTNTAGTARGSAVRVRSGTLAEDTARRSYVAWRAF